MQAVKMSIMAACIYLKYKKKVYHAYIKMVQ